MITRRTAGLALFGAGLTSPQTIQAQPPRSTTMMQIWQELFATSQRDKKGLTFWIGGQPVGGLVLRVLGEEAVEVRNQMYSRIVIRLSSVEAVAIN